MGTTKLSKRGTDLDKLTDKERMFVAEYPVDFNGKRAVIDAGYSKKGAAVMAWKLLQKPRIQRAIGKAIRERVERLELDGDELLRQVAMLGTRDGRQLFDKKGVLVLNHRVVGGKVQGTTIHDLPEQITAAIDGVKQKVKRYALESGIMVEEVETEVKLVGKATILDMAAKIQGVYAPEQHKVGPLGQDWNKLIGSEEPRDEIETKILDVKVIPNK